jgi:uncharacterized membrane protein YeaQ/YmgE (transglycosylase-associated protein family)
MITGDDARMGAFANIIVGIIGALLGSWIVSLFGSAGFTGLNVSSFLVAILGSVVLLWIVSLFAGRRPVVR